MLVLLLWRTCNRRHNKSFQRRSPGARFLSLGRRCLSQARGFERENSQWPNSSSWLADGRLPNRRKRGRFHEHQRTKIVIAAMKQPARQALRGFVRSIFEIQLSDNQHQGGKIWWPMLRWLPGGHQSFHHPYFRTQPEPFLAHSVPARLISFFPPRIRK